MGTLSKALGTSGAYVVGPTMFIQYVVNTTRSFIYTTASPPATVAASLAALRILRSDPARRARLWKNRDYFADGLKNLGFCLTRSQTPILPIVIGDSAKASTMAELLLEHGVLAPAIRPPTVPRGSSRIRTTVSSEHTREQLDLALLAFRTAGRKLDLI
jgi:glycine C-acetyltransferase/8-amino-7-oxononanoate synthase